MTEPRAELGPRCTRVSLHDQHHKHYPIPSIWENMTSVLPSFGTPTSGTYRNPSSTDSEKASKWNLPGTNTKGPPSDPTSSRRSLRSYLPDDPLVAGGMSAGAAVALTLLLMRTYRRHGKRIKNSDYVTSGMLERKIWVKGVVTSVGDGDNFRLFHTPLFYRFPFKIRTIPSTPKELKNETLHIRISGVDAPEAAHFGNPAQPHSQESLDWLRKTILGRQMKCQLLRKDQYNRIVAVPYMTRWILPDRPLPLMMLEKGMAVVYTSGGGEYGDWGLEKMQAVEAEAKRAKRGLWALKKFEHPADYKKRVKAGEEATVGIEEAKSGGRIGLWGFVRRLLGR